MINKTPFLSPSILIWIVSAVTAFGFGVAFGSGCNRPSGSQAVIEYIKLPPAPPQIVHDSIPVTVWRTATAYNDRPQDSALFRLLQAESDSLRLVLKTKGLEKIFSGRYKVFAQDATRNDSLFIDCFAIAEQIRWKYQEAERQVRIEYVPKVEKQYPTVAIGAFGGYGATLDGLRPMVGVGVMLPFISW